MWGLGLPCSVITSCLSGEGLGTCLLRRAFGQENRPQLSADPKLSRCLGFYFACFPAPLGECKHTSAVSIT